MAYIYVRNQAEAVHRDERDCSDISKEGASKTKRHTYEVSHNNHFPFRNDVITGSPVLSRAADLGPYGAKETTLRCNEHVFHGRSR